MKKIASLLLAPVKGPLKSLRKAARIALYSGEGRLCAVCDKSSRRFRTSGNPPREDAQCVHCGALERHRFLWLFLTKHTDLFNRAPKTMLHVAPEPCFEPFFRQRLGNDYLTADLFNPAAMVKMDVTDIQYPAQSFDVVYCSHVLEHVPDDRRAMREFHRVLKNSGWAILLVPITAEKTFEDPTVKTPEDRLRVYGQKDHVRRYGPDFVDRLRESGFKVKIVTPRDLFTPEEIIRMGLSPADREIYFCTK